MKSKKAQEILGRSYDGGHVCIANAELAVEIAEAERDEKAIKAHREMCQFQFLFDDDTDNISCALNLGDCTGNCEVIKAFIKKLNEK